ncbi:enoyl-CoA hydratase/isomerase family protein, partial [Streptomyces sp. NPDC048674]|uniref:enoyl-CoA hydratase/isomerase family protein n=1 Tax=Streptomyces sp. NPDC048674 TaxID=3155491 RepID=UPI00343E92A7
VHLVDRALTAWEHDPAVETVVITGAGDRGLCAEPDGPSGDVRKAQQEARLTPRILHESPWLLFGQKTCRVVQTSARLRR